MTKELSKEMLEEMNVWCDGLNVYHKSNRRGIKKLNPCPNSKEHPKGIIGKCTYYNIGWYHEGKQYVYPYHRVLYAWYNGIAHKGMDIMHIDGDSFNNELTNLKEGTRKENLSSRRGAKNQYWKRG